jgi:hypothetical protein
MEETQTPLSKLYSRSVTSYDRVCGVLTLLTVMEQDRTECDSVRPIPQTSDMWQNCSLYFTDTKC